MEISDRLLGIVNLIDDCDVICDIGTDHAYLPIYLIKNKKCKKAIAIDINKGPLERARENIKKHNIQDEIDLRLGFGFDKIKVGECEVAIIAGMGGNLIRDIIEKDTEVFKSLEYMIVEPAQNPEVLREYIYTSGFRIIDETAVLDDGKYYQNIKVTYDDKKRILDPIHYEVGEFIYKNNKDFILSKIWEIKKKLSYIKGNSESGINRKIELKEKVKKLEELLEG